MKERPDALGYESRGMVHEDIMTWMADAQGLSK